MSSRCSSIAAIARRTAAQAERLQALHHHTAMLYQSSPTFLLLLHVSCCCLFPCLFPFCSRTGLYYNGKGTGSARNITRRNYFQSRSKADQLRILGASTNATQIIRAACNTSNILDSACIDVLLLALTPPSYSSNNTLDTPLRRAFISPAQVSAREDLCCMPLQNS